ncbi:unnamed protein product [Schistocephalus solidus]|uniref:Uncharacterized protein n=1 Tax=Schistocephalus solidus TaxID=70667 RepID=A0A183TF72_SCHSO|nr:unnamed protein product [Schistocephalus solidus]
MPNMVVWWHAQARLRPRQPPAPSPTSGLLDSVKTPGSGGRGGESAVDAAPVYYHFKLNHAQVTVPAPPFRGAYGGPRRTTTVELSVIVDLCSICRPLPLSGPSPS